LVVDEARYLSDFSFRWRVLRERLGAHSILYQAVKLFSGSGSFEAGAKAQTHYERRGTIEFFCQGIVLAPPLSM
jgi:hypothetical protein